MARHRKTIEISKVVEVANLILAQSKDECVDYRKGVISMIEDVLLKNDIYQGFGYHTSDSLQKLGSEATKPGIIFDYENHNHQYPDETRRFYY